MRRFVLALLAFVLAHNVASADLIKLNANYNRMVLMTSSTDHITGATGLTLTITAANAGGAFGAVTPTVTERGNGWYAIALTATETGTLGVLNLHVTATGADPTDTADQVVAFDPTDAVRLGLTALPNANAGTNGGLPLGNASGQVTVSPTDANVAAAVWSALTSGYAGSGSFGARLGLMYTILSNFQFDGSNNVKSSPQAYGAGEDPATLVLGATAASWNTTGTIGNKINSGGGGGGGDPWATLLTSETTAGSFGAALKAFIVASPSGWLASDSSSVNAIVNGVFAHQVEATVTLQQALEIIAAYCGGNVNTGNHTYSGINTPGTVRITYVLDAFGNRNFSISP